MGNGTLTLGSIRCATSSAGLKTAPFRRWIEIGEGTHMIVLEKNRWQVINAIVEFLRE